VNTNDVVVDKTAGPPVPGCDNGLRIALTDKEQNKTYMICAKDEAHFNRQQIGAPYIDP
jgi:hypothetical protein